MKIEIEKGVRLYVDVEGTGLVAEGGGLREKPTLVLVHGGPGFDHSGFRLIFPRLADLAQVVYYDHRSQGRSDDRPPSEWTLDTWADDIVRLCDALGIAKPIVVGQSFGGMVVQRYLARHQGHPGKAVISSTSHSFDMPLLLSWFEKLGGAAVRDAAQRFWSDPADDAAFDEYVRVCMPVYNTTPQPPATGGVTLRRDVLTHWIKGESRTMSLLGGLGEIRCPTLVLAGAKDPVCPVEGMREIAAAVPAAWRHYVEFPDAGHGVWRDSLEAAVAVLRGFVAEQMVS